jgi:hypothetical protein
VKNKMVGHFLALIAIVSLVETWLESWRLQSMLELFFFLVQHLVSGS